MVLPSVSQAGVIAGSPWITSGYYDTTSFFGGSYGTAALIANTLYALPIVPIALSGVYGDSVAVDRIAIEVTTNAASGKKARLGLYAKGSDGKPGALIVDAGEVLVDAIAGVELTIAVTLRSGVEVFAAIVASTTPTLRAIANTGLRAGATSDTDTTVRSGWSASLTYTDGSTVLPDPFTASPSRSSGATRIMLRAV